MTPQTRLAWIFLLSSACAPTKPPSHPPLVAIADPGLVEMTAEPTTSLVLASGASELGVRVRITARELPPAQRPPLDLALVLDTSGSMEGQAIDALRLSARELASKLRDGDRLSVVVFHSKSEVLVPNVVVEKKNRVMIDRAIGSIHATGTTDLAGGLALGLEQLRAGLLPNSNVALPQLVTLIRQSGVSVTSLGFGGDYDTTLMTQIARDTGGSFHYLEQASDVAGVFDSELAKMTTSVARNMQLVIEPGPGVTIPAMPGLSAGGDGKLYAAIGDLPAGDTRDLMIPIQVTARGDGSTAELVQATLKFDDVIGKSGVRERDAFVAVKTSRDTAALKAAIKIDLEVARIRTSAAAAILLAINLARSGQIQQARQSLATATAAVKAAAAKYKGADLDQLLKELETVEKEIAQIVAAAQRPVQDIAAQPIAKMPATAPSADVESDLRRAEEKAATRMSGQ